MKKYCKVCNTTKTINSFNKHKGMSDGHLNKCKCCEKLYKRQYYKDNKNTVIRLARERNKENYKMAKRSDKYKQVRNSSRRERYATDLEYKIKCILRSRLVTALKGSVKQDNTIKYLGCSVKDFKKYIQNKFRSGMSWDNWRHDIWHLDHIKPLASFDLTNENELIEACHYTNLQPLWAEENLKKSAKVD